MRSLKAVRMLLTVVFNCGDLGEEAQMLGGRDTEGVSVIVNCSLPHPLPCAIEELRLGVQSGDNKWQAALNHVHAVVHTTIHTSGFVERVNDPSEVTAQERQIRQRQLPLDVVLHCNKLSRTGSIEGKGSTARWNSLCM